MTFTPQERDSAALGIPAPCMVDRVCGYGTMGWTEAGERRVSDARRVRTGAAL
ncbi:MAG TPA: hypothetical protein VLD17_07875 [Gemmatimonadaceae bacterium]|nr:hypothetical protein [Gemmatimonadaceae bacterium]